MPGVPLLDELMANAWCPMVGHSRGGWRYRWAAGVTRRANSALALGTDGSLDDLVASAEVFYGKRGVPATIQVTNTTRRRSKQNPAMRPSAEFSAVWRRDTGTDEESVIPTDCTTKLRVRGSPWVVRARMRPTRFQLLGFHAAAPSTTTVICFAAESSTGA